MVKRINLVPLVLALLLAPVQAKIVDRAIAVVNGHLMTWSDLDEEMRFEALENARPLNALTEADRRAAFEHLLQFRMLRSQMQGSAPATDGEVKARISEIRAAWQMANDDVKWNSTLSRYELSSEELHELVANQIEILRFLEYRVRPIVRVTRKEVEEYYKNTLVPELKARGHGPEPIESVTSKIRQLLAEQKENVEMEKWLDNLRKQSRIEMLWDGVK